MKQKNRTDALWQSHSLICVRVASIVPLAQTDVMQTFLFGINDEFIGDLAQEIPKQLDTCFKSIDENNFAPNKKDVVLNNLLYTLDYQTRADEVITLCKTLIESTKDDSVKYDACRILASCYKENGQNDLVKPTLEVIPEIYFSKLELMASLLDGEDSYEAAQKQKNLSAEDLIDMLIVVGKRLKENGELEKANSQFRIALKVMDAFEEDFIENKWFKATVYECTNEQRKEIETLLAE